MGQQFMDILRSAGTGIAQAGRATGSGLAQAGEYGADFGQQRLGNLLEGLSILTAAQGGNLGGELQRLFKQRTEYGTLSPEVQNSLGPLFAGMNFLGGSRQDVPQFGGAAPVLAQAGMSPQQAQELGIQVLGESPTFGGTNGIPIPPKRQFRPNVPDIYGQQRQQGIPNIPGAIFERKTGPTGNVLEESVTTGSRKGAGFDSLNEILGSLVAHTNYGYDIFKTSEGRLIQRPTPAPQTVPQGTSLPNDNIPTVDQRGVIVGGPQAGTQYIPPEMLNGGTAQPGQPNVPQSAPTPPSRVPGIAARGNFPPPLPQIAPGGRPGIGRTPLNPVKINPGEQLPPLPSGEPHPSFYGIDPKVIESITGLDAIAEVYGAPIKKNPKTGLSSVEVLLNTPGLKAIPGAVRVENKRLSYYANLPGPQGDAARELISSKGLTTQIARNLAGDTARMAEPERVRVEKAFIVNGDDTPVGAARKIQIGLRIFAAIRKARLNAMDPVYVTQLLSSGADEIEAANSADALGTGGTGGTGNTFKLKSGNTATFEPQP